MSLRHTSIPEIIAADIGDALNIPGLQHIKTHVDTCEADGETSGKIDFMIAGTSCGVSLLVNADRSFILLQPGEPKSRAWTAEEAAPETIKEAILIALRTRVKATA